MNDGPALTTIFEADNQTGELLIELQHLHSILYFLDDFFAPETFDPDSPDEHARVSAYHRMTHYIEYRNLFEVAVKTLHYLCSSADTLSDTITAAFAEVKKITA